MATRNKIGVLDLQGGVHEHVHHFNALGIEVVRVKKAEQLNDLAGIVLPGGESTCMIRLLNIFDMAVALKQAHADGMKIWGTCAGAILIANQLVNDTPQLQLMDIAVERNAFGFQIDSFNAIANVPKVSDKPIDLTFIRAPKIVSAGKGVEVLLKIDNYIAAAEDASCLATVFHPELTSSLAFHRYFALKCGVKVNSEIITHLDRTSWMELARITNPAKK